MKSVSGDSEETVLGKRQMIDAVRSWVTILLGVGIIVSLTVVWIVPVVWNTLLNLAGSGSEEATNRLQRSVGVSLVRLVIVVAAVGSYFAGAALSFLVQRVNHDTFVVNQGEIGRAVTAAALVDGPGAAVEVMRGITDIRYRSATAEESLMVSRRRTEEEVAVSSARKTTAVGGDQKRGVSQQQSNPQVSVRKGS
ncbi:hypothetical protein CMI37_22705 [Candidatus Pacearchaeota archaeon]|nr:hypothetical protein [Candidatus Pacearchaeota archaeon]